jgi:hypothetical protein
MQLTLIASLARAVFDERLTLLPHVVQHVFFYSVHIFPKLMTCDAYNIIWFQTCHGAKLAPGVE